VHQAADAVGVLNIIQPLFSGAMNKNVTGKQRFNHPNSAALSRTLDLQPRMEHFQVQVLADIGGRNVLVLRLGPSAVPGWTFSFHFRSLNNESLDNDYDGRIVTEKRFGDESLPAFAPAQE
jgi:hypothetical protein